MTHAHQCVIASSQKELMTQSPPKMTPFLDITVVNLPLPNMADLSFKNSKSLHFRRLCLVVVHMAHGPYKFWRLLAFGCSIQSVFFYEDPTFCGLMKWRHFSFGWPKHHAIHGHHLAHRGTHYEDDVIYGRSPSPPSDSLLILSSFPWPACDYAGARGWPSRPL